MGDGEVGLAGGEGDAAGGRRERDLDIGAHVEVHHRAIDEGDLLLAGRRGGVVLSSGGRGWKSPPHDGGERECGGEAGGPARHAEEGGANDLGFLGEPGRERCANGGHLADEIEGALGAQDGGFVPGIGGAPRGED